MKGQLQQTYQLPEGIDRNLEDFKSEIERYKAGAISYEQFRPIHVRFGIYDERRAGDFMLRVRLPGGMVLPHQMRRIAAVAKKYGDGVPHVTTRQDIQIHKVSLDGMYPALRALLKAGLITKGGGGDCVRNITSCPYAGVCKDEVFDVTPYVTALTEFLMKTPDSFTLPRKFKIAFSGCSRDCAGAMIHDVGFIARSGDTGHGFGVYAAGGLGAGKRIGERLEEFLPESDFLLAAEAVKKVFNEHGDRGNRGRARLRLAEKIGPEALRKLYQAQVAALRAVRPAQGTNVDWLQQTPVPPSVEPMTMPGFDLWKGRYTTAQKQEGFHIVEIPLFLGDIPQRRLLSLAHIVEAHGEGLLRATPGQNLLLRWVPGSDLADLFRQLRKVGLTGTKSAVYHHIVTCTGASTCRLGICLSRGAARAVAEKLMATNLPRPIMDLPIHISGCPNSCGRHPIAPIGLMGAVRKADDHALPYYVLTFGGRVGEGVTRFGSGNLALPAKRVPDFLAELLDAFARSDRYPDFDAFLEAGGLSIIASLGEKYRSVPAYETDRDYYRDWGSGEDFSLDQRG